MKRKGSKKNTKPEEDENGIDESRVNGDEDEPKEKKNRRSKGKRSKASKHDSEPEESDEDSGQKSSEETDVPEKKNRKPKGKKTKGSKQESEPEESDEDSGQKSSEETDVPEKKNRKSKGKKSKVSKHDSDESEEDRGRKSPEDTDPLAGDEDNDAEYEVEAILDDKMVKNVRHFLIRWKGYTEESDTWEPEHTLDCADLIKDYKNKSKKDKKVDKKKGKEKKEVGEENWDENEDFEVDRIRDVYFHKDGKRDFLVSWKGYPSAQNTWEPEDNMDCKDLIKKFMAKVEAARKVEGVESKLRVVRKQVNRLAYSMHESGRKLSRRHRGKERVRYFDAE